MRKLWVAVAVTVTMTMASASYGDDVKKGDTPKPEKKASVKPRGTLPRFFDQLKLSDEQKEKIAAVRSENNDKVNEMRQQISELSKKVQAIQTKEMGEIEKVLTDDQKTKLKEMNRNPRPNPVRARVGTGEDKDKDKPKN